MAIGKDNLQYGRFAKIPKEELIEISRKGALAAKEKRRQQRLLRDIAFELLNKDVPSVDEVRSKLEERGLGHTYGDAMLLTMALKAIAGDVGAARFVRDTSGQKPAEQIDLSGGAQIDLKGMSDEELLRMMNEAEEQAPEEG